MAVVVNASEKITLGVTRADGDGGGIAAGRREPTPAPAAGGSMGDAVTPHALITGDEPPDWRFLICGLDTVDLGLYVDWDLAWYALQPMLDHQIDLGMNGKPGLFHDHVLGKAIIRKSSKRNYRYHMQFADWHLWITASSKPNGYPNVYCSPTAKSLWTLGIDNVVQQITSTLAEYGANVMEVQVSRCDLSADFWMSKPLTLDFLKEHRVSRTRATNHYENDDQLETYYLGRKTAPVQVKIYDKLKKVLKTPETAFFIPLWGGPVQTWRVEFQLRRAFLRQIGVNSVEDLKSQAGGMWKYLTEDWLSLRLQDNKNTKRRTVHPWWQQVQGLADLFGPACTITRDLSDVPKVPVDWYVAHIAGCLPPIAARLGITNQEAAIEATLAMVIEKLTVKSWDAEVARQLIRLQQSPDAINEDGGEDVPF